MKITKRQLKRIVKEEKSKILLESSRAGESHDAGYEDGSRGLDPAQPDDMDYMQGWEIGDEDARYDAGKLAEVSAGQAVNINREQFSLAGANQSHQLGAAIEEAIALAQQARNGEVLALLEEAHELLMGY